MNYTTKLTEFYPLQSQQRMVPSLSDMIFKTRAFVRDHSRLLHFLSNFLKGKRVVVVKTDD